MLTEPAPGCRVQVKDTPRGRPRVSVVILTHNEEINLADCLVSLSAFDDVHVLDSGSTDGTVPIACARGVPIYSHAFEGFGRQRNWAIDNIPTRYEWQFHLDADERMTPELTAELTAVMASDPPHGGYYVPSKFIFQGKWLRHAGQYPGYQVRCFHKQRVRFVDHGHGQRETTRHELGFLKNPILHHALSKGIDDWFIRHVKYARREAEHALDRARPAESGSLLDRLGRRRALKRIARRLPGRYFLRLSYMLLVQRALLDGWQGVTYAHMLATYEGMIDVYLRLLRHDGGGVPSAPEPRELSTPPRQE